jgi:hypothetical protein
MTHRFRLPIAFPLACAAVCGLLTAMFVPAPAHAAGPELEAIEEEFACSPENGAGEFGWMLQRRDTSVCVFAQFPRDDGKPFIRVGGRKVLLQATTEPVSRSESQAEIPERVETFRSLDGRHRVTLRSRVVDDSCPEAGDKCCGQSHEGELTVRDGRDGASYRVGRWSGG